MTPSELRERTLTFAVSIHRFIKPLLREPDTRHVGMQLFRASSSVASNYRAAGLGRSRKEFTAKIGAVAEEADESLFWITFVERSKMLSNGRDAEFASLSAEARSLAPMPRWPDGPMARWPDAPMPDGPMSRVRAAPG